MRFEQYIELISESNIDNIKLNKIVKVFSNIPKTSSPKAISNYIVNSLNVFGVKNEGGNSTYISGPMSNLPDDNWPTFIYAEKYLKGTVVNPAKPHGNILKKHKSNFQWIDYMTEDIYEMMKCNKCVLLPGYSRSVGAKVEIEICKKLLNIKPVNFRDIIGDKKYFSFVEDVKRQYIKDGNEKGYYSIIEPMLLTKSERESSSFVKPVTMEEDVCLNENVVDIINNVMSYVKTINLRNVLRFIGLVLKNSNLKPPQR